MAERYLDRASNLLSKSFERLSSGQRINRASDDAAGLAIADSLRTDSRVYNQAQRNVNDGVSALNIASGSLTELTSIVTRQMELSEQAANGTYTVEQRRALHSEAQALTDEFNRIVATTKFNGVALLNGDSSNLTLQLGYGSDSLRTAIGDGILRNVGNGTFTATATLTYASSLRAMTLGDINNDGRADVIAATNVLNIQIGQNDGSFGSVVSYTLPITASDTLLSDINRDGIQDIVVASNSSSIATLIGNADGSFQVARSFASSASFAMAGMSLADLNGDGFTDVVGVGGGAQTFGIFLGNGDGTFSTNALTISSPLVNYSPILGDINNDGRIDLIARSDSTHDVVLMGTGTGSFGTPTVITTGTSDSNPLLVDINYDGNLDLLHERSGGFIYMLGNGNGSFQASISIATGQGVSSREIASADLNGDGISDIFTGQTGIGIVLSNGDGTFSVGNTFASGLNVLDLSAGDTDGDGGMDFAIRNGSASVVVYRASTERKATTERLYLLSRDGALEALGKTQNTLLRISSEQQRIGSHMSRLTTATNVLYKARESSLAAESRIRDVDVAEEAANVLRAEILQSAAASILSRSSELPKLALDLLRNT